MGGEHQTPGCRSTLAISGFSVLPPEAKWLSVYEGGITGADGWRIRSFGDPRRHDGELTVPPSHVWWRATARTRDHSRAVGCVLRLGYARYGMDHECDAKPDL